MSPQALHQFVRSIPKVDLHLHLLGSTPLDTLVSLLQEHPAGIAGIPTTKDELQRLYDFRDFDDFIRVYELVARVVDRPEAVERLVVDIGRGLSDDGVRYAEVTVTPYTSMLVGLGPDALAEALSTSRELVHRSSGVRLNWVYDFPGDLGARAAAETLGYALRYPPEGLVGFGVGGPEVGVGRGQFAPLFKKAREAGLKSLPHAGEAAGPRSVWSAIHDLGADRIGHGISAVEDPQLLEYLAKHAIPLEVSVSSNVATRVVPRIDSHPLPRLVDHGLTVTLCTDDGPMFRTNLTREYLIANDVFGYGPRELMWFARNAILAAYCSEDVKVGLLQELESIPVPSRTDQRGPATGPSSPDARAAWPTNSIR